MSCPRVTVESVLFFHRVVSDSVHVLQDALHNDGLDSFLVRPDNPSLSNPVNVCARWGADRSRERCLAYVCGKRVPWQAAELLETALRPIRIFLLPMIWLGSFICRVGGWYFGSQ